MTSAVTPGQETALALVFQGADTITVGRSIEQPSEEVAKNTLSLWQADLDTAVRYGGELTRAALGAMEIRGDKKYVVVDTKVHMLMPGQSPAIPGWHTDGAPRLNSNGLTYSPLGSGPPDLQQQRLWDLIGDRPRFHLLVTGEGCLTEFLENEVEMSIPSKGSLYANVTKEIEQWRLPGHASLGIWESPSCTALEWGWWHLHAAKLANKREWRFLIRVTESDYHAPQPSSRLNDIIRTQQMVYSPIEFGW